MTDTYDNEMSAVFRDASRFRHLQKGLALTVNVPTPTEDKPNKKVTVIYGPNPEEGWSEAFAQAIDAARGASPESEAAPFCPVCGAAEEKTVCVATRESIPYGSEGKSVSVIVPHHYCSNCQEKWTDHQTEAIRDFAVKEAMAADYAAKAPASAEPTDDEMNAAWWQFFQDNPGTTWAENLRHLLHRFGRQVASTPLAAGNEWQQAMLGKLEICSSIYPDGMTPAQLLDRIISWHVNVALDPGFSMRVHFAHCHQREYANSCKYGDMDCPAAPVAWRTLSASGTPVWEYGPRPQDDDAQPLYLHPLSSPLGYLTDEDIRNLDDSTMFHESPDWPLRFARNVLAAAHTLIGATRSEPDDAQLTEHWNSLCGEQGMPWAEKIRWMLRKFGANGLARAALIELVRLDAERNTKSRHADVAVRTAFHAEWEAAIKQAAAAIAGAPNHPKETS